MNLDKSIPAFRKALDTVTHTQLLEVLERRRIRGTIAHIHAELFDGEETMLRN